MIREFRPEDIENVMCLWLDTNIRAHDFIDSGYWHANFEAVKNIIPKAAVFVYEQDGNIQAFIGLMENHISGIFVSDNFRSKGIGKLLLDHAKAKHGELYLNVYKKNLRAIHFYLREGFVTSAKQVDKNTGEAELVMKWESKKI